MSVLNGRNKFLSFEQAAALIGERLGRRYSRDAIYRWARDGRAGVRLRTTRIGCWHAVRLRDIDDFLRRVTARKSRQATRIDPRRKELEVANAG